MVPTFRTALIQWQDITALNLARNKQAQDSLQTSFGRGLQSANSSPQAQENSQQDESHALADATIKIPRAGAPVDDGTASPDGPDVVVLGTHLIANNTNLNEQSQTLDQQAKMDPGPVGDPVTDSSGAGSEVPPRFGASNFGPQEQYNVQNKKAFSRTRTRLVELVDSPEIRRAGALADITDIRANTFAQNTQSQQVDQKAVLEDQGAWQVVPLGARNVSGQLAHSEKDLVTHSEVLFEAPVDEAKAWDAKGIGTFHGTFNDITADGTALNNQTSFGNQLAVDANASGGDGQAANNMPQLHNNRQNVDTRATLDVRPRPFVDRDNTIDAQRINANTIMDSEQIQGGNQHSQVEGFGSASNEMPSSQTNQQTGVTVASVDIVF